MQTASVALRRVDPGANMVRFYHAVLWPDLFGGVTLARERGRLGQLRLDAYSDPAMAQAALVKFVQRKQRKGYREAA